MDVVLALRKGEECSDCVEGEGIIRMSLNGVLILK